MRNNKRWKATWVVAALVAAALLGGNGLAVGTVSTSSLLDGGFLHLHFGSDGNRFFHEAPSGGTSAGTEGLDTSGCAVTPHPGDPTLAIVTATGPKNPAVGAETAGNTTIGLGVKVKGGNGANCGQVNPGETLSVKVGISGFIADKAELDIDAKYSVTLRVQPKLNGANATAAPLDFPTSGSDSGPDNTSHDNFAIDISPERLGGALFDELVLSPVVPTGGNTNAAFSLEGGRVGDPRISGGLRESDGTYDTLFHLIQADGALGCDPGNNTATQTDTTDNISTTLTRALNSDGSCVLIPYNLDLKPGEVDLQKDLSEQTGIVNFSWSITWAPELAPPGTVTQIDYGDGRHDVQWCDAGPTEPGNELWCFTNRDETLINSGTYAGMVQVTETFYGHGDPKIYH